MSTFHYIEFKRSVVNQLIINNLFDIVFNESINNSDSNDSYNNFNEYIDENAAAIKLILAQLKNYSSYINFYTIPSHVMYQPVNLLSYLYKMLNEQQSKFDEFKYYKISQIILQNHHRMMYQCDEDFFITLDDYNDLSSSEFNKIPSANHDRAFNLETAVNIEEAENHQCSNIFTTSPIATPTLQGVGNNNPSCHHIYSNDEQSIPSGISSTINLPDEIQPFNNRSGYIKHISKLNLHERQLPIHGSTTFNKYKTTYLHILMIKTIIITALYSTVIYKIINQHHHHDIPTSATNLMKPPWQQLQPTIMSTILQHSPSINTSNLLLNQASQQLSCHLPESKSSFNYQLTHLSSTIHHFLTKYDLYNQSIYYMSQNNQFNHQFLLQLTSVIKKNQHFNQSFINHQTTSSRYQPMCTC